MFIISGLVLPSFSLAQGNGIKVPETFEEAKELGERALEIGKEKIPGTMETVWNEKVLPLWTKMYEWARTNIWLKIQPLIEREIEKRIPLMKEKFEKEKQEMKEELPVITKSLWQRFIELWK